MFTTSRIFMVPCDLVFISAHIASPHAIAFQHSHACFERLSTAVLGVLNAEVPQDNKIVCEEGSTLHALRCTPSTSCSITRSSKVKATLNSVLQAKNAVFQIITLLWRQTVHIHSLPVTQQEAQLVLHLTVGDAGQHYALQVTGVVVAIQQVQLYKNCHGG